MVRNPCTYRVVDIILQTLTILKKHNTVMLLKKLAQQTSVYYTEAR